MRQVTLAELLTLIETGDYLHKSIIVVGRYIAFRRSQVEEWVYCEVPT